MSQATLPRSRTGIARMNSSSSTPSLGNNSTFDVPVELMPACFSSHKALQDAFSKNPGLFTGQGKPHYRRDENFFPGNFSNKAVESMAYRRRQILLPEIEYLHRSKQSDAWQRYHLAHDVNVKKHNESAGAPNHIIYRDMR
mmetsp:Transcript_78854/g.124511  ORF Transcript_78854/g.124511 Transcript_78854/m.124511 type:complete len:141 (-) Transcript_78854:89-511(-)